MIIQAMKSSLLWIAGMVAVGVAWNTILFNAASAADAESSARTVEAARPATPSQPPPSPAPSIATNAIFGPVIERAVDFEKLSSRNYLDLESGEIVSPRLERNQAPPGDMTKVLGEAAGSYFWIGRDMAVVEDGPSGWDATPARVLQSLQAARYRDEAEFFGGFYDNTVFSNAYFIRTSKGSSGIFQMQYFSNNVLHLRYKLLTSPVEQGPGDSIRGH